MKMKKEDVQELIKGKKCLKITNKNRSIIADVSSVLSTTGPNEIPYRYMIKDFSQGLFFINSDIFIKKIISGEYVFYKDKKDIININDLYELFMNRINKCKIKRKTIIVINGKGSCGKDTLITEMENHIRGITIRNVSSIDPIKNILLNSGEWNGEKTPEARNCLSDLKMVFEKFNNLPFKNLKNETELFLESYDDIMFVHIREPEEIEEYLEYIREIQCDLNKDHMIFLNSSSLLISSCRTENITYGNNSDDFVNNYEYSNIFVNDASVSESANKFKKLIKNIHLYPVNDV